MDSSDATSKEMSQDGWTRQEAAVPPQQVRAAPQLDTETPFPVPGGFLLLIIYPHIPWGGRAGPLCCSISSTQGERPPNAVLPMGPKMPLPAAADDLKQQIRELR